MCYQVLNFVFMLECIGLRLKRSRNEALHIYVWATTILQVYMIPQCEMNSK